MIYYDNYGIFQWIYNEKLRKTIITLLKLWDYTTENIVTFIYNGKTKIFAKNNKQ